MTLLERLRGAGFVLPDYAGGSLVNLAASILDAFGARREEDPPPVRDLDPALLRDARVLVLVLVDGLGELQLRRLAAAGITPHLADLRARDGRVLTSIFPSSTVSALGSLDTARPPAAHGLVGFTHWLEEFGTVAQMLRWGPADRTASFAEAPYSADPRGFVPVETLDARLARAGAARFLVQPATFKDSPLVRMLSPDATYVAYVATSSAAIAVRRLLEARPWGGGRAFLFVYWPTLDTVTHALGPASLEHDAEARAVDALLVAPLVERVGGDAVFLLTADHGHVALDPAEAVRFEAHPELLALLRYPPAGEPRVAFLAPRDGSYERVRAYCALRFPDALCVDAREALAAGLYGAPVAPVTPSRTGELLLLATGRRQYRYRFSAEALDVHLGSHGGLSPEEMLVPLLAWRG